MQLPTFEEWFEATHHQTFDDLYCHGGMHLNGILSAHIRHSREYMQAQLQAIADQREDLK